MYKMGITIVLTGNTFEAFVFRSPSQFSEHVVVNEGASRRATVCHVIPSGESVQHI